MPPQQLSQHLKTVLITGVAGNVGSALANGLLKDGSYSVVGVDNLSTGSWQKLPRQHANFSFIKTDVNEYSDISAIFHADQFDYVFHFAAVVGVQRTLANPLLVLQDVDGASAWINRDLSQALTTNLDENETVNTMRVDWIDLTGWAVEGAESHFAEYTVVGTNLMREFDGDSQIVARRIANIEFSRVGSFITVAITSTLRDTTVALSYFITPRADGALP